MNTLFYFKAKNVKVNVVKEDSIIVSYYWYIVNVTVGKDKHTFTYDNLYEAKAEFKRQVQICLENNL